MKNKIAIGVSCAVIIILLALTGGLMSKDTRKDNTKAYGTVQKTVTEKKSDDQSEKADKETEKEFDSRSEETGKEEKNNVNTEQKRKKTSWPAQKIKKTAYRILHMK